jgi:hypothetical protein
MSVPLDYTPLMEAVVGLVFFYRLSSEEAVHPDAAAVQLEQIATLLRPLEGEARAAFAEFIAERCQKARRKGRSDELGVLAALVRDVGLE